MLERKDSATEINEALFSSVKNTSPFWCRLQAATQTAPYRQTTIPKMQCAVK